MTWQEYYQQRLIQADEAANMVKSGDNVVFTSGREAITVGLAIAARKEELKGVHVLVPTPSFDLGWYDRGWEDSFQIRLRIPTATSQEAIDERRIDVDCGTLIPLMDFPEQVDVLLTEISPPDDNGFCSFGASLWAKKRQVEDAKLVIAEVNPVLIRTFGDNFVHVSEIDYFVEHHGLGGTPGTGSLAGRPVRKPEPYINDIIGYARDLIRDGDTIQIGVGRTTEPMVKGGLFDGKHDLGWHSEATPPGVIGLIRDGVINGKRKTINKGVAVVTSVGGGSKEEMNWVNNNPLIRLVDVGYLEDIRVIASHDNYVAINQALMVDLGGQICAETIGTRQIGAAGGQIPFAFGAILSKGGRSITILPSTAKTNEGLISRIVPTTPNGTVVTVQRNCAQYIVTEYGVAHIWGKSLRQRAEALITVAHPDFRSDLKKAAAKLLYP